jgi:flagellar biosynthesis protein FlhG
VLERYVAATLEGGLRLTLLGEVPVDAAVREAVQRRELLLQAMPGAQASQALMAMATRLADAAG